MTFAVFPYLGLDPTARYLYENVQDLMAHLQQMLEAVAFCHSKLVAHRDLFDGNFLCNFAGGPEFDRHFALPLKGRAVKPFRSLFPFSLYLIDFEMAVCFDPSTSRASHLVSGTPAIGPYEYARPRAPELLVDEPYNPFLLDIWQIGTVFSQLQGINKFPSPALSLMKKMTAEAPGARPTAEACLAEWRTIISCLTKEERMAPATVLKFFGNPAYSVSGIFSSPAICPARTADGRDVVIRLITIGDDGKDHKEALERLSTGNVASVIGNHAVPVLQWLHLDELTFAVFPYLSTLDPTPLYAFENLQDMTRHLLQMLEAIAFCHSKFVAHRDVFPGNFMSNFCGGVGFDFIGFYERDKGPVRPFRSLFPFMVYLIDFEMAVCFDPKSAPSTQVVSSKPYLEITPDTGYLRPAAPELVDDQPYNPFMLDVWQLGTYFADVGQTSTLPPSVLSLIARMTAPVPAERPTVAECLKEWRQIMSSFTHEELLAPVIR
ncbi:hypothetical protein AURDEDRAFT_157291 [Auricularia subglabra TFB-10046 SS5]|nr:hypothetical protein AURDEDRAFT_157291 [Auricularia subglabra TFB-10046 SS5]